jgi:hypothetical protein
MAAKIPTVHGTQTVVDHLTAHLRAEAAAEHAQYPQYDGYWDDWRLAEVTRRVKTKRGVAFEPGDLVLVSPEVRSEKVPPRNALTVPYEQWPVKQFATAYSTRNKGNTGFDASYVREVVIVTD